MRRVALDMRVTARATAGIGSRRRLIMTKGARLTSPDDDGQRLAAFVRHAEALAARAERLPVLEDHELQAARRERLRALRWAVTAGAEYLRSADRPSARSAR